MLYSKVRQTIKAKNLIEPGDRIVVGVSGGPDSVALLNILAGLSKVYGIKLFIAHLNHKLRGGAARRDADFVGHLAANMKMPCLIEEYDVRSMSRRLKISLEDAARQARYALYGRAAKKFRARKIATAHTLDDQAETVLMRFITGSGPAGLSGIPYKRKEGQFTVIRPLLDAQRKEIEKYLKKNKIGACFDASNMDNVYLRNKIRNKLIPFLEKSFNPNIKENLSFSSAIFADDSSLLDEMSTRKMKLVERLEEKGVSLDIRGLMDMHPALRSRVVRRAIAKVKGTFKNITYKHWSAVEGILRSGERKGLELSGGVRVARRAGKLFFALKNNVGINTRRFTKVLKIKVPGKIYIPELSLTINAQLVKKIPSFLKKKNKNTEYVNGDILAPTIKVRTRREGDRIIPLGMKSSKKLQDIFVDEKISHEMRDRLPVILSGARIVWVARVKLSDEFCLKDGVKKIVKLSVS